MERSSGILLPISSLPSAYGIGTLGKEAYRFADFLKAASQRYWQVLPLGPTSYGDSPYQSFSSFAGNPYFIDLELLIEDGLLEREEVEEMNWGTEPRYVDYGKIYESRFIILEKAKERGYLRDKADVDRFVADNSRWLPDYALFMACKRHFGMAAWTQWPDEDIRFRRADAVERYRKLLCEDVELFIYIQFLFFRQWNKLKSYINSLGIKMIGDVPIYVAMDSADVWAEPGWFQLDSRLVPTEVSGVPPDYFSADGQLWGNPLYRWDEMEKDGFGWWIRRIDGASRLFDVIRIDHFRGFDEYWAVPYGEKTAKNGVWKKGPGYRLVGTLKGWFHGLEFIAEDLGITTPTVDKLLEDSGWPGMKVLEFGFDPASDSSHAPHNHTRNSICYTGTHDNSPVLLWKDEISDEELEFVGDYLGVNEKEGFAGAMLRAGASSVSVLFVAQMQDYLKLGKYNRMNEPGTSVGNWQWRMLEAEASPELAEEICKIAVRYGRAEKMDGSVSEEEIV